MELNSINEIIITEVQKYPYLYNMGHKDYRNEQLKNKIWMEIGDRIGLDGDLVFKKWANLRDRYVKEKKKEERGATPKNRKWELFEMLSFINTSRFPIQDNFTNVIEHVECENQEIFSPISTISDISIEMGSAENTGKKNGKSRNDNIEEKTLNLLEKKSEENEHHHFCMSLVPIFKRLPPQKAAKLKVKIIESCNDIEFNE